MADTSKGALASVQPVVDFMGVQRNDLAAVLGATNSTILPTQTDAGGSLRVVSEGGNPTYTANSQFAADATAVDIATFPGVSTKVCKIKKIVITTYATTRAIGALTIVRRSTANLGSTAVGAATACLDITDAAPAAAPVHLTAHATALGTAVATVWAERIIQGATAEPMTRIELNWETNGGRQLVVRNASDFINISAVAALGVSGNLWSIDWEWIECPTTA